jgi:hypothetical protein
VARSERKDQRCPIHSAASSPEWVGDHESQPCFERTQLHPAEEKHKASGHDSGNPQRGSRANDNHQNEKASALRAKLAKKEILVPHPFRQPHRRNGWETTNLSPVLKERNFSPAEEKHEASGHDFSRADKTQHDEGASAPEGKPSQEPATMNPHRRRPLLAHFGSLHKSLIASISSSHSQSQSPDPPSPSSKSSSPHTHPS